MADADREQGRVIDATGETPRGAALVRIAGALALLAVAAGFVVGFGSLATLRLVDLLQEFVWDGIAEALPEPLRTLSPILLCTVGGALVGTCTKRFGFSLETLGVVVARCRKEGGYRFRSWPQALTLFALPIAFGGSVGPEAGISGIAAALGTMAMHGMRRSGVAAVRNDSHPLLSALASLSPAHDDDGRRYARGPRTVLWAIAGVGFVLGAMAVSLVFGPGNSLPRFAAANYLDADWGVALVAVALGLALAWFTGTSAKAAHQFAGRMGTVPRAVVCGIVLGTVAVFLPDVLFSGQSATNALVDGWREQSALVLLATCVAKLALTQLCVTSGWVGGEFFPLIFCGVAAGFSLALLTGTDPLLTIAVSTGTLLGAVTDKWVLSTAVLALCFPPASLPAVAVAAVLGAKAREAADARHGDA